VANEAIPLQSTRGRKLAAETGICCQSEHRNGCACAQVQWAKEKITGTNSPQKSFSGQVPRMILATLHFMTASRILGLVVAG
jgi:hypothetical protein